MANVTNTTMTATAAILNSSIIIVALTNTSRTIIGLDTNTWTTARLDSRCPRMRPLRLRHRRPNSNSSAPRLANPSSSLTIAVPAVRATAPDRGMQSCATQVRTARDNQLVRYRNGQAVLRPYRRMVSIMAGRHSAGGPSGTDLAKAS